MSSNMAKTILKETEKSGHKRHRRRHRLDMRSRRRSTDGATDLQAEYKQMTSGAKSAGALHEGGGDSRWKRDGNNLSNQDLKPQNRSSQPPSHPIGGLVRNNVFSQPVFLPLCLPSVILCFSSSLPLRCVHHMLAAIFHYPYPEHPLHKM